MQGKLWQCICYCTSTLNYLCKVQWLYKRFLLCEKVDYKESSVHLQWGSWGQLPRWFEVQLMRPLEGHDYHHLWKSIGSYRFPDIHFEQLKKRERKQQEKKTRTKRIKKETVNLRDRNCILEELHVGTHVRVRREQVKLPKRTHCDVYPAGTTRL